MDAALLQRLGGLDALPGGGDLDEHPVGRDTFGLVQLDDAFGAGAGGLGVKTQAGIHLGGHTAWHAGQNLAPKTHQQPVHDFIQRAAPELGHRVGQQRLVVGLLHRLQDQRRVGRGVLRAKLRQLLEITGVGDHGGELLQGFELVHVGWAQKEEKR